MKKTIQLLTGVLFISLLFLGACKKSSTSPVVTNTAVIKLNGAQPAIDSVKIYVNTNSSGIDAIFIDAYINSSSLSYCSILLQFSPSDPLFATGAIITTGENAVIIYEGSGSRYWDPIGSNGSGIGAGLLTGFVTITKNDVAARRIEGTLTGCVVTNSANAKITIDGSFAVTYPAP